MSRKYYLLRLIKKPFSEKRYESLKAAEYQSGQINLKRSRILEYGLYLGFTVIALRATILHLTPPASDKLNKIANTQYLKTIPLLPFRGEILDRRDVKLGISTKTQSIAVNPRVFSPSPRDVKLLSSILGISRSRIRSVSKKNTYFSWLKRKANADQALKAKNLELNGLWTISEPGRMYPAGDIAGSLLGMVGLDNSGLFGLERLYNQQLTGKANSIQVSTDGKGNSVYSDSIGAGPQKSGHHLHLTIDLAIQEITEKALEKGVINAKAKKGFAIVSDPHTGKILAIGNYPRFNPNQTKLNDIKGSRNSALLDLFEPGSIVKPITIAAALDANLIHDGQQINCENGRYRVGRSWINDDHPHESLSIEEILVKSNNVCTYKVAEILGGQKLFESLKAFGIGDDSMKIHFPGELSGRIPAWQNWRPIRFANISFGQGLSTKGLEIIQAYSAFANGGHLIRPSIVDKIVSNEGEVIKIPQPQTSKQIIKNSTARLIRRYLKSVVENGTGRSAKLDSYSSGGKTGTSEKYDPQLKAYSKTKRIASFVGIAPINDPHLVILVYIDEPGLKPYYGGKWAAPVFKEIGQQTLEYLNVPPKIAAGKDKVPDKERI